MTSSMLAAPTGVEYSEIRQHDLRKSRMVMIDGNLVANMQNSEGGVSARVFDKGYWGFASVPTQTALSIDQVTRRAVDNVQAMSRFGEKSSLAIPLDAQIGEFGFNGKTPLSQQEKVDLVEALNALCKRKYKGLKSSTFILHDEAHNKSLKTSNGADVLNTIRRAAVYMVMTVEDDRGEPIELMEAFSGKGSLAELDLSMDVLEGKLDRLYEHLQAKRHAVPARGGLQTVVLAPELAGMLAHEAMGHPCEADLVLGGSVTGNMVGKPVASELVTMIDFAHTYKGEECMIPVYADDEGSPGEDAVLIENGIMRHFMTSRETAARLGIPSTGNARAYTFNDEPLVRMRNTAILPGKDKLEEMIAGVEEGYYLMKSGNGQADSTSEFMFGIDLAYEIKNGKLGNAIKDTTVSGTAINMLRTVDAVSDDMVWECNGYCGKKQPMIVSSGGPALRGKAHLGGE
ncbi:MAG: TldD/PmbA family protein [Alphaproteobacteria bacterium]|nr:MAG: TldD/PmbA family protein [Alphaproteobacteria bacterium]